MNQLNLVTAANFNAHIADSVLDQGAPLRREAVATQTTNLPSLSSHAKPQRGNFRVIHVKRLLSFVATVSFLAITFSS